MLRISHPPEPNTQDKPAADTSADSGVFNRAMYSKELAGDPTLLYTTHNDQEIPADGKKKLAKGESSAVHSFSDKSAPRNTNTNSSSIFSSNVPLSATVIDPDPCDTADSSKCKSRTHIPRHYSANTRFPNDTSTR
ncbi:hypothetical protein SARC_09193 [Sphaeroforma arctica JP610]|uniref:Uncharacterized protein n=1 Tax=Sphaeroforma arctica JP610 TaxID=667725 RepID=A0A0L0FPC5_9EUKA|nr:hypothetical protein SARC_09193 [Sphaeroforma arctica JP610]KNC78371.1 hypothetical protein SARC_09193 [Sphaeroforma arctica JP610]|eukprot:XP_014152273.1 hypothetical protein SARC_09193 [Sphaeroforma arctica JP610]